jgi:large subunit ribosomal protein L15
MFTLDSLSDNKGARKNRVRVGRGIGCTKGKTCGRGVKGQKSRSGVAIKGFEGGQMPIFRRLPKRGFTNIHRIEFQVVNVFQIDEAAKNNMLSGTVTAQDLQKAGLIRDASKPVKLLGNGEIKSKISLHVNKASASAESKIAQAGGSVTII